jgi:nuclease S1
VFFLERKTAVSLHQCWDSLILIQHKRGARVVEYAEALNAKIDDKQALEWAKSTPLVWANESHRLAVEVVYKDVPADGDPPKIGQVYIDQAGPVIDQQLQKAGVRLAILLSRCFAGSQ